MFFNRVCRGDSGVSIPRVLTIAGSDSGGGAGIQADLKTFTALNVFGMTAVTAITAQNTQGVTAVHEIPASIVSDQIDAVVEDIGVDAIKLGMLANAEIVETVAAALTRHAIQHIVVDPVMIATSGDTLLNEDAVEVLKTQIIPRALILTPNIPEAETLSGVEICDGESIKRAARTIHELGAANVLIKGGHADGPEVIDTLFNGQQFHEFRSNRIATRNTHGTGCTLSAAIAAYIAKGSTIKDAVTQSLDFVHGAILTGLSLGSGHGSLNHMHMNE